MPISLERSITISLKLLVTQSVVMARMIRVRRKSDARILSTTFDSVPATATDGAHVRGGELLRERGADGFDLVARRADFDDAGGIVNAGQCCGGLEGDEKFLIFRAAGGNDSFARCRAESANRCADAGAPRAVSPAMHSPGPMSRLPCMCQYEVMRRGLRRDEPGNHDRFALTWPM